MEHGVYVPIGINERIYFITSRYEQRDRPDIHFFSIDDSLVYMSLMDDFGPLNISCIHKFNKLLSSKVQDKLYANKKIFLYSSNDIRKKCNAIFLLCSYSLVELKRTPEESFAPFRFLTLPSWHDASNTRDTFGLTILDCLRGLRKAMDLGFYDPSTFDHEEYDKYEQVQHGDMAWIIPGKFLALAGPAEKATIEPEFGYVTISLNSLVPYFKQKNINAVVQLNAPSYNPDVLHRNKITHHLLHYPDGSNPPEHILQKFLEVAQEPSSVLAVHCKAGLGRTGTCIGAYMMKHYTFSAREAIGWMRLCRPGSVIGNQQTYLAENQVRFWTLGTRFRLQSSPLLSQPLLLSSSPTASSKSNSKEEDVGSSSSPSKYSTPTRPKSDVETNTNKMKSPSTLMNSLSMGTDHSDAYSSLASLRKRINDLANSQGSLSAAPSSGSPLLDAHEERIKKAIKQTVDRTLKEHNVDISNGGARARSDGYQTRSKASSRSSSFDSTTMASTASSSTISSSQVGLAGSAKTRVPAGHSTPPRDRSSVDAYLSEDATPTQGHLLRSAKHNARKQQVH
jgi:cell division cycle 14